MCWFYSLRQRPLHEVSNILESSAAPPPGGKRTTIKKVAARGPEVKNLNKFETELNECMTCTINPSVVPATEAELKEKGKTYHLQGCFSFVHFTFQNIEILFVFIKFASMILIKEKFFLETK